MSESATLECPATPEHTDQCPATPEDRASVGSDQRSDTPNASENSDRNGSASPPPNCAICLGRCINKCFTDNCIHHFCFNCLLEWSKIKPECPLCKQTFKSIIHNVRSPEVYEEYIVNQQPRPHSQPLLHRLNVFLSERPRFRYRATLQVRQHESEAIQQLLLQQATHDHLYYDRWLPLNSPPHTNRLRRQVYDLNLHARPLADVTGRIRDCSAAFYRENPAQVHRLMPWLTREIHILTNNLTHRTDFITTLIQNLLQEHDISSPQFFEALEPHLLTRTRHFLHEFLVFARSPFDIYGYDRHVRYDPGYIPLPTNLDPVVISTEEEISDEEDDDVRVIPRGSARTEFTIEARSNVSTVIVMGSLGVNYSNNNDRSVIRDDRESNAEVEVINSTNEASGSSLELSPPSSNDLRINYNNQNGNSSSNNVTVESLLTDSDSDECLFVREQKPPHLRTPELVVLNSEDEDSDVVFVDENDENNRNKKTVPLKKRPIVDETNCTENEAGRCVPKIEVAPAQSSTSIINENFENAQPSTSIDATKMDIRRKLYFKPIRKYKVNGKSNIFENSSSSESIVQSPPDSPTHKLSMAHFSQRRVEKTPPRSPSPISSSSSSSHEEYKIYNSTKRKKRQRSSSSKRKTSAKKSKKKTQKKSYGCKTVTSALIKKSIKNKKKSNKNKKLKSVIVKNYKRTHYSSSDETDDSSSDSQISSKDAASSDSSSSSLPSQRKDKIQMLIIKKRRLISSSSSSD